MKVSASIVLYNTEPHLLSEAIASFAPSAERKLFLVDNSPHKDATLENLDNPCVEYIFSGDNRGYGAETTLPLGGRLKAAMTITLC